MDHAAFDRAGSHDRNFDHQVVKAARLQARQHRHLRARFDLEHADGIGLADHVVGGDIAFRHILDAEFAAAHQADQIESPVQGAEHAQRQHIDFQQPQRVEIVLVPFDHRALGHGGVLDRHQARQRPRRQDEAARMLAQMTRHAQQLAGQDDHLAQLQFTQTQLGW